MAGRYLKWMICRTGRYYFFYLYLTVSMFINFFFLLSYPRTITVYSDELNTTSLPQDLAKKVMEYINHQKEAELVLSQIISRHNIDVQVLNHNKAKDIPLNQQQMSVPSLNVNNEKAPATVKAPNTKPKEGNITESISNETQNIESFLAQPIVNPHEYEYIFNQSNACSDASVKFIIAVPSAPENFQNRLKVREKNVGQFAKDPKNKAKLLFFLGKPSRNDPKIQQKIDEEEKKHGDMVQSSFIDSYRNITKKAALILKWSSTFCDKSKFVLRNDDDVYVNLTKTTQAVDVAKNKYGGSPFIIGNLARGWKVHRNKNSKYYVSPSEYPGNNTWPDFLVGGSMGYSVTTAELLFNTYLRLKLLWLDDVFITSFCARKVGVAIYDHPAFHFIHRRW